MKKIKFKKLKLWHKTAITLASFVAATSILFGAIYASTKTSKEIFGTVNQTAKEELNTSIDLNNPSIYFYEHKNEEIYADVKTINGELKIVVVGDSDQKAMNFHEFIKYFYNKHKTTPNLVVKYGSFKFINEYVESIELDQFVEFAQWFIKNVAWGPDILTLKTFSIVKGVSVSGSSVTLGAHANNQKELTEIKFYPDSFFGSMPIFSTSGGRSQYDDSLTYSLNRRAIPKQEVQRLLNNVKYMNIRANDKTNDGEKVSFRNLMFAHLLKNRSVYTYQIGAEVIAIDANDQVEAFDKLNQFVYSLEESERFNVEFNKVQKAKIQNVSTRSNLTSDEPTGINIAYDFGIVASVLENDHSKITQFNLDNLEQIVNKGFVNFKDFYYINQYLNEKIFIYDIAQKNPMFFKTEIEARDLIPNFDKKLLKEYTLSGAKVSNQNLLMNFIRVGDSEQIIRTIKFEGLDESNETFESFKKLKNAFGYRDLVKPFTLKLISEEKKENGEKIENFEVYTEAYQNLLESLKRYRPSVLKEINGHYIKKTLNENGEYKYEVAYGKHFGLDTNDRVPFIALMYMSDPNFKGISYDFLRYVGAHEYGHHSTLENSQNISSNKNPVLIGGLSLLGGASILNYFSEESVRYYLQARTTLDFRRVNVENKFINENTGEYINFNWLDSNGNVVNESLDDIWGKLKNDDLLGVLENDKRRFIQQFEELKKAADKRGIRVSDLFVMNSYDTESGTLNPMIRGKAKYMVFKKDGSYEFKAADIENIKGVFRDGANNLIEFDENNLPIVIKFKPGRDNEVLKVMIYDKNNKPIINVPLDRKLTETELEYVNNKIKQIQNDILKIIDVNYFNSGWDNRGHSLTSLDVEPRINFIAMDRNTESDQFDENGNFKPSLKVWGDFLRKRENERFNTNNQSLISSSAGYFADIDAIKDKGKSTSNFRAQVITMLSQLKRYSNPFLPSSSAYGNDLSNDLSVLRFENMDQYIVNPNQPLSGIDNLTKNTLNAIIGVKFLFEPPFRRLFNQLVQTRNEPGNNNKYWFLSDTKKAFKEPISDNNSRKQYHSIAMKPNILKNDSKTSLFNAFVSDYLIDYVDDNNIHHEVLNFYSMEDFVKFHSIDFTKLQANKSDDKLVWNWDVQYVKTKFDLNKFKQAYTQNVNERQIKSSEKQELLKLVENEQKIANLMMQRFREQNLDFFFTNNLIEENFDNILSIFDQKIGAPELDFNKYVFEQPNINNFEYTAQDIYGLIKKLYEQNKYDLTKLRLNDLYYLIGGYGFSSRASYEINFDNLASDNQIFRSNFKPLGPTQDVVDYNATRVESSVNDIFGDYVYTYAENLTRDYVQITYKPSLKDFGNLVDYLKNVNEANTGLEYVLDGSKTEIWKNGLNDFSQILENARSIISQFAKEKIAREINNNFESKILVNNIEYKDAKKVIDDITFNYETKWKTNVDELRKLEDIKKNNTEALSKLIQEQRLYKVRNFQTDELELGDYNNNEDMFGLLRTKKKRDDANSRYQQIKEQQLALVRANQRTNNFIDQVKNKITNNKDVNSFEFKKEYEWAQQLLNSDPDNGFIYVYGSPLRTIRYIQRAMNIFTRELINVELEIKEYDKIIEQYEVLKTQPGYVNGTQTKKVAEYEKQIEEKNQIIADAELKIKQLKENKEFATASLEYEAIIKSNEKILEALKVRLRNEYEQTLTSQYGVSLASGTNNYYSWRAFNSNYIGKLNTFNNGYFKDRWLRDEIDWGLYDDQGNSILDDKIKITDLDNKTRVKDRARAFWVYLLKTKGVGQRTITGIWRDRQKDALALWGYAKLSTLDKVAKLAFRDIETNEIKYLVVNSDKTNNPSQYNNLFYFKKQADDSNDSKVTLANEGYGAWMSNYAFMSKYSNTLLSINKKYEMYFVDENNNKVEGLSLGDLNGLAENGKHADQAPIKIVKEMIDNTEKTIIVIKSQFNTK